MHVNKNVVRGLLAVTGLACAATTVSAQAVASNQVWEVRFVVDNAGPFAQGPNATAVGITMQARVALRANTATNGSTNLGISRVGGSPNTSGTGFLMTFADPLDSAANHGTIGRGETGEQFNGSGINDSTGAALAGHFAAYRGSYAPSGSGGSNTDTSNGTFATAANGNQTVTNVVGSRAFGNTNPGNLAPSAPGGALGAATLNGDGTLSGEFASIYRFIYTPRFQLGVTFPRDITVTAANMGVRYVFRDQGGGNFSAANAVVLPAQTFTFRVPGPGAAALVGLGGLIAGRRRRA